MHALQEEEALLRSYKGSMEELGAVEYFMLGVRHCLDCIVKWHLAWTP